MVVEVNVDGHVFTIRPDNAQKNKYYCVMQNPFKDYHDTKVIFGGSYEIVERKINREYKKLKERLNNE